jgi:3',5'-cyclic AMP phosphodiesterase CpdA
MNYLTSRRGFLQASASAFALLTGRAGLRSDEPAPGTTQVTESEPFRFVHLTDIHVAPERQAEQGLVQCLHSVLSLDPRPDFILTGGDLVMDVFKQEEKRARKLFTLLRKVFDDNAGIPVHHCIGNHDVFGWGSSEVQEGQTGYGKQLVSEYLELPNRYYRFDHKGWRFFVLDDIQPAPEKAYQAYIDDEQFAWLEAELKAKPQEMPAAAVCHIPLLSVTVFGEAEKGAYQILTSSMCRDVQRVVQLFSENNVRLSLSGHLHQLDRIEFRGVEFICDGAVSGGWWKGPHKGFEEGYGVIDLGSDGSIQHQYLDYGWEAKVS